MGIARRSLIMFFSVVVAMAFASQLQAKSAKSCTSLKAKACSANKACVWKDKVCTKGLAIKSAKKPAKKIKKAAKPLPAPEPTPDAEDLNNLPELDEMGTGDGEDDF